jgi:hypothetical protein
LGGLSAFGDRRVDSENRVCVVERPGNEAGQALDKGVEMRSVLMLAVLVAAAGVLVVGGAGANNAALVIDDQGNCNLFDGDGTSVGATSDHAVINKSGALLTCKVTGVANSSGKAVHYDPDNNPFFVGLQCGILGGPVFLLTDKWTETVSASGVATLRCHVDES